MTNFNEKITNATTKTDIQNIVAEINNCVLDNQEHIYNYALLDKKVKELNADIKNEFIAQTVNNIITDRKKAFEKLVKKMKIF